MTQIEGKHTIASSFKDVRADWEQKLRGEMNVGGEIKKSTLNN